MIRTTIIITLIIGTFTLINVLRSSAVFWSTPRSSSTFWILDSPRPCLRSVHNVSFFSRKPRLNNVISRFYLFLSSKLGKLSFWTVSIAIVAKQLHVLVLLTLVFGNLQIGTASIAKFGINKTSLWNPASVHACLHPFRVNQTPLLNSTAHQVFSHSRCLTWTGRFQQNKSVRW